MNIIKYFYKLIIFVSTILLGIIAIPSFAAPIIVQPSSIFTTTATTTKTTWENLNSLFDHENKDILWAEISGSAEFDKMTDVITLTPENKYGYLLLSGTLYYRINLSDFGNEISLDDVASLEISFESNSSGSEVNRFAIINPNYNEAFTYRFDKSVSGDKGFLNNTQIENENSLILSGEDLKAAVGTKNTINFWSKRGRIIARDLWTS